MLVDTSVWIDYFNGHASPEADRLAQAIADAESIALPGHRRMLSVASGCDDLMMV